MKLERQQILSLYLKVMKKLHKYLSSIASSKETPSAGSRLKDVSELQDTTLIRVQYLSLYPH